VADANKPRVGSAAWDAEVAGSPGHAEGIVTRLAKQAGKGDEGATKTLAGWLASRPDLKSKVSWLADLATRAERAWEAALANGNAVLAAEVRQEAAALRAELVGPGASVVERVLATAVVVGYMAHMRAVMVAARSEGAALPAVVAARDRRVESAQRRLVAAIKAFDLVAGKPRGRRVALPAKRPAVAPPAAPATSPRSGSRLTGRG